MRSEFWFAFSWNPSTEFSVKTSSSSMSSVGSSAVNNTLLFLLDTLVLTSSENMLCKSPLSPLGELVEARVVSGSAAKGTDFLESMVSKLSKVSFDLPFLDLNWWKIQFGYFLKDVFHLVCSPQSLLHVSFRSKIVPVHQNCFDLRRLLRTRSLEHISLFADERHWHPWLTEQARYGYC